MKYFWTDCPRCRCHVAVNTSVYPDKISGSLRRWSADRTINDGRSFEIPANALAAGGGFTVECVCGQALDVPGGLENRDGRSESRAS